MWYINKSIQQLRQVSICVTKIRHVENFHCISVFLFMIIRYLMNTQHFTYDKRIFAVLKSWIIRCILTIAWSIRVHQSIMVIWHIHIEHVVVTLVSFVIWSNETHQAAWYYKMVERQQSYWTPHNHINITFQNMATTRNHNHDLSENINSSLPKH